MDVLKLWGTYLGPMMVGVVLLLWSVIGAWAVILTAVAGCFFTFLAHYIGRRSAATDYLDITDLTAGEDYEVLWKNGTLALLRTRVRGTAGRANVYQLPRYTVERAEVGGVYSAVDVSPEGYVGEPMIELAPSQ